MNTIEKVCFPVSMVRNQLGRGNIIRNELTGQTISTVSDRYTLVRNEDIIKPFIDRFGEDNVTGLYMPSRRKCAIATIATGRTFDLGGGDIIKEQLIIKNSYDKTASFSFHYGAFRMVCSNGMYSGMSILNIRQVHVGKIDAPAIVRDALKAYDSADNNFSLWRSMASKAMTLDEQKEALTGWNPLRVEPTTKDWSPVAYTNRSIMRHADYLLSKPESLNNRRDVWGLYNQMNRAIYDCMPSRGAYPRRMAANLSAERFLIQKFNLN